MVYTHARACVYGDSQSIQHGAFKRIHKNLIQSNASQYALHAFLAVASLVNIYTVDSSKKLCVGRRVSATTQFDGSTSF